MKDIIEIPAGRLTTVAQALILIAALLLCVNVVAQEKQVVQVKTFDHQLKALGNVSLSINDRDFISVNAKGSAFTELLPSDLPIKSVRLRDDELEAESWNYSKGVVEIIIRKKSFKVHSWTVRDQSGNPIPNLRIDFKGRKSHAATSGTAGQFSIPLALDERFTSVSQFSIDGYSMLRFQLGDKDNILFVEPVKQEVVASAETKTKPNQIPKEYFKNFDLSMLDSIQSLTVFYSIFKNVQLKELSDVEKRKIDNKFNQLVKQLEDSVRRTEVGMGRISDSSFVKDDLSYLLSQAREENDMLEAQRADFDEKIKIITNKLQSGIGSLDQATRDKLLSDLTLLEMLLKENESQFFKNQNDYRAIINSLKERFFDLSDLESRLSASELQRLEEQRVFRQRLLIIISIAAVFAVMIVLLIRFSNKLRKQKVQLEEANSEIKRMNENLEILVYVRTKLLAEAHKELDTFLYRASHDLRSPVCSIIGLCNIAGSILPAGESKELIDRVVTTTESMDKLLKKLSLISEINQPTDYSEIYLLQLFQAIEHRFKQFINENRVKFSIRCSAELTINSYPNLITAIFTNVIENALYYSTMMSKNDAVVEINVTTQENKIVVSVFDNGIGVDPAIQPRIFDMFYKGNVRSKGNGLGLYIVNKSVQALEGEIQLESVPGEFSRFIIHLPTNRVPAQLTAPVAELQEA